MKPDTQGRKRRTGLSGCSICHRHHHTVIAIIYKRGEEKEPGSWQYLFEGSTWSNSLLPKWLWKKKMDLIFKKTRCEKRIALLLFSLSLEPPPVLTVIRAARQGLTCFTIITDECVWSALIECACLCRAFFSTISEIIFQKGKKKWQVWRQQQAKK